MGSSSLEVRGRSICYTISMIRSVSVVAFVCGGIVFPFFAFAAFVGPSSAPPYLNTKGLVWDIPAASTPTPETFVDVTGDIMTGQLHLAIPSGNAILQKRLVREVSPYKQ